MKKTIVMLILMMIIGLALVSCEKESVTYCIFCGQASLKEVSTFNKATGRTEVYYECTNSKCGKTFGAGKNPS
jgi:ribosomal protein L44E